MQAIDYPLGFRPDQGKHLAISDNVHWLRMPLPFLLGHINLWLLDDGDGWSAIDTGIHTDKSIAVWQATFDSLLKERPLQRVIVTHMHPDHAGMAGWLTNKTGASFHMTRLEYLTCRVLSADTGRDAPADGVRFYRAAGMDEEQLAAYRQSFGRFGSVVSPLPESYERLQDGQRLRMAGSEWEVICANGHSPEHACLYSAEQRLLVSGDQILPTISSNVGVWPTEPRANPLADWLGSCRMLAKRIDDDVLVLPAHGKPFRAARLRLEALIAEHEEGLGKLLTLCAQPQRAIDVFAALFRGTVNANNLIMAIAESVAHLNYLVERGELQGEEDNDGVLHYRRA